ncbi:MAG: GTPase ArgK [Candidatus Marinimicrobia bacterium]|nr:GTPase ArgK [Candidatus Neomarinimicrobiota bacterium]
MARIDTKSLINGDIRSVSRAISFVENNRSGTEALLDNIFPKIGRAYRIGVTGPPGAGKSTLVDKLISLIREQEKTVGVISIDPTSPFSGGALLGDRIRMSRHSGDAGVYIRSMASRGSMGGLAVNAQEAGDILDAAGMDIVIFETVGVGQVELDVAEAADTTVVVLVPESGDEVQAMKSGLMEIADIFVLNKSDREGADRAFVDLRNILDLKSTQDEDWPIEILQTAAMNNEGIDAVYEKIQSHYQFLQDSGGLLKKRQRRYERRVEGVVRQHLNQMFWSADRTEKLTDAIEQIETIKKSPYKLAQELIQDLSI